MATNPAAAGRRKRLESFDIVFRDGVVDGWVFGVVEAFREQLDIRWDARRRTWTQGSPPLYRFDVGQVFYDPPHSRKTACARQRTAQITEARSDEVSEWVKIKLWHFKDGKAIEPCSHSLLQVEFVAFLLTGQLPAEHETCDLCNLVTQL
jgi:hypothetical protein